MRIRRTLLIFLLLNGACLFAQNVDLDHDRAPVAPLPAVWRFHTGDDPAWARADLDDSRWSLLRSDRSWAEQGYDLYKGFCWYRFKVLVPAHSKQVSIMLPSINGSFEAFANGMMIAKSGKMPPHPSTDTSSEVLYAIPIPARPVGSSPWPVTIAIRLWWYPLGQYYGGGPTGSGGLVGESSQLQQQQEANTARAYWPQAALLLLVLFRTLTAFGAFALFLLRRNELEYLWFSLMTACTALRGWLFISLIAHTWREQLFYFLLEFLYDLSSLASLAFYVQLLRPRRTWVLKVIFVMALLLVPTVILVYLFPGSTNRAGVLFLLDVLDKPAAIYILALLLKTAFTKTTTASQRIDAQLLLVPYLLGIGVQWFNEAVQVSWNAGWQHTMTGGNLLVLEHPFEVQLSTITGALALIGVFAVLLLRFSRSRREQERFSAEVEGARNVQQFLIPADLPAIPGLTIESDYRPALEVGGDFFQIIPDAENGSALILVGDVAGKGLQAGMLATLLVGASRTAATFTRDPALILSTLNNRLHGKGNATCLILKILQDGAAILVNAGHLPPYLNGVELPMEGALPLGVIPNMDFPVLNFQIKQGDTLTLISDGILEAQTATGELFGFDRITSHLAISVSAASLATAAQAFGQTDDITVLTIARNIQPVIAASVSTSP